MRVIVTAVSSYSGMCIAEGFAQAGATITGTLTRPVSSYSGRNKLRLLRAQDAGVTLVPELEASSGSLASWLATQQADVWVHHHHPMDQFRSPNYDLEGARSVAVAPLSELADAWKKAGVRSVIYSGTYFEPGEGQKSPEPQATPYARLKAEVSAEVLRQCEARDISFSKVVITTPTGALENEDRLTPQLLLAGQRGAPFLIRSPDSVFDTVPGEALGPVYVRAAEEALAASASVGAVYRPSGWVVRAVEWASWVQKHLAEPLGMAIEVEVPEEGDALPPTTFFNPPSERLTIDWDEVARRYVDEWRSGYPFL